MYITKEELLEEGYDEGAIDAFIELFGEAVKSYNKALQSCIEELGKFVNIYLGSDDSRSNE